MINWMISTPVWGYHHIRLFVDTVLPAIRAAMARSSGTFRFLIHTDDPSKIKQALAPFEHHVLGLTKGIKKYHAQLGDCHRDALVHARRGECIAFINADMVPSVEIFEAAEKRFAEGKRMIIMAATRTLGGTPPVGAKSADILRWTMDHRHPIISELFWGSGSAREPWAIYFKDGDDIVMHSFHMHPFAAMKDRDLSFKRKTIDWDLPDNFTQHEIHVVTDADEAAFAEMSPPAPILKLGDPVSIETTIAWARQSAVPMHRWFFGHRVAICGDGRDIGDGAVCEQILRAL